jgi:hypothetical protein
MKKFIVLLSVIATVFLIGIAISGCLKSNSPSDTIPYFPPPELSSPSITPINTSQTSTRDPTVTSTSTAPTITTPVIPTPCSSYAKYELKSNDARVIMLPYDLFLFSFEYPCCLYFLDTFGHDFQFLQKQYSMPYNQVDIIVFKTGSWGIESAKEQIETLQARDLNNGDIQIHITNSADMKISQNKAYYYYCQLTNPHDPNYPQYNSSCFYATFDYGDLICRIQLLWFYHGDEPPEIKGYFDHIISTFTILNDPVTQNGSPTSR